MKDPDEAVPDSSKAARFSLGPLKFYAYHDYAFVPWRSPLYVGARFWDRGERGGGLLSVEWHISPASHLRPFSGCGEHNTKEASEMEAVMGSLLGGGMGSLLGDGEPSGTETFDMGARGGPIHETDGGKPCGEEHPLPCGVDKDCPETEPYDAGT